MADHKDDDYESLATETAWVEVPCQRNISSGQFAAGVEDYVFSIARPQVWMPSQSYFKFELELLGAGDPNPGAAAPAAQPTLREGVAFAENAIGNMYTNVFCLAGGQSISSITNYVPQASQLMARTAKSAAWQSTVGKSAWQLEGSFAERAAAVCNSGFGAANAPSQANAAVVGLSGLGDCREVI